MPPFKKSNCSYVASPKSQVINICSADTPGLVKMQRCTTDLLLISLTVTLISAWRVAVLVSAECTFTCLGLGVKKLGVIYFQSLDFIMDEEKQRQEKVSLSAQEGCFLRHKKDGGPQSPRMCEECPSSVSPPTPVVLFPLLWSPLLELVSSNKSFLSHKHDWLAHRAAVIWGF